MRRPSTRTTESGTEAEISTVPVGTGLVGVGLGLGSAVASGDTAGFGGSRITYQATEPAMIRATTTRMTSPARPRALGSFSPLDSSTTTLLPCLSIGS
jgi:hypothetical protein